MRTILIFRDKLRLLVALATVILAVVACGGDDPTSDGELTVVATTSIWGDVVAEIVGDDASVEVLIPRGADPHDYQASPRQVAAISNADLVIANGLGLEEGLEDVIDAAISEGVAVYEVAEDLDPIEFAAHGSDEHEDEEHEDEEHQDQGHDHGSLDPHVWFDPTRVALAAEMIASRLTDVDDSIDWQSRADAYAKQLSEVDAEIRATLESVPDDTRKLVTNHDSLGYLADRYGYEIVGVVIPGGSTLADPSSAELAALVSEIEEQSVPAIFTDTGQSTDLAEAVASEVGYPVQVIQLFTGSLGEPGSGAERLAEMLITNAVLIADGLS